MKECFQKTCQIPKCLYKMEHFFTHKMPLQVGTIFMPLQKKISPYQETIMGNRKIAGDWRYFHKIGEILEKMVHTGLANCTRNIEKALKNRGCLCIDILKTLLRSKNLARFSENSALLLIKKLLTSKKTPKITHISL